MKSNVLAFFLMVGALLGNANAEDRIRLYIGCSTGQKCVDLAHENGTKESVFATPVQELTKDDIQSASVKTGANTKRSLEIELTKEASGQLEQISSKNIGKKLIVVLNDKILTAPTIGAPITSRRITISSEAGPFLEKEPWLQQAIKGSYKASGRQRMAYVIIALAILITAAIFIFMPRMRQRRHPSQE